MVSEVRNIIAVIIAFVAPFIYYSASNTPLQSVPAEAVGPAPIYRLQGYLRVRTDHAQPDYEGAIAFLNTTITTLLPGVATTAHAFAHGKPVLLVRIPGEDPSLPAVLLNSHMDVVPVEPEKWSVDPFGGAIVTHLGEARVYGRGAQDMKSVGLQYVEALSTLMAIGWRPKRRIILSYVPDEEIGGHDGMKLFVESPLFTSLNIGVALDEGAPHPNSTFNVLYGERQRWWLHVSVAGSPGHGATLPTQTASGILHSIVARALTFRDLQLGRKQAGADIGEIVNVNLVFQEAGTADARTPGGFTMNMIPSVARAGFDIRIPPTVSQSDMDAEIKRWITCSNGKRCPGVSLQWISKDNFPVVTSRDPRENSFIIPFAAAMREARIDHALRHGIFYASTDSRFIRQVGIPCFGFSPIQKTPNLLHKHDEYISVDGYLRGIEIYQSIIRHLADFNPVPNQTKIQSAQYEPMILSKLAESISENTIKQEL